MEYSNESAQKKTTTKNIQIYIIEIYYVKYQLVIFQHNTETHTNTLRDTAVKHKLNKFKCNTDQPKS